MKTFTLTLLGLMLVTGGCSSTEYYAAPANATAQTAATVTGSRTNFLSLVRGVEASVTRVDDKPVVMRSYDQTLLIAPGTHRVLVTAVEGPVTAVALVEFKFEVGRGYIVRASDIQTREPEIWFEDARTGQLIGRRFSADLRASSPPPGG